MKKGKYKKGSDNEGKGEGKGSFAQVGQTNDVSFAQVDQAVSSHTCDAAHNRSETGTTDFYTLVNQTPSFVDNTFPNNDAIYWQDDGSYYTDTSPASHANDNIVQWKRPSEISQLAGGYSLFGADGVTMHDIQQGQIGNCWWMAACIAVAEYPGRIEKVFLNQGASDSGVYSLQFYALGAPITITVDDTLPTKDYGGNYIDTLYGYIGPDMSIWGAIMEKAFAKITGNYARIVAGDVVDGINTLNNSPYERNWHGQDSGSPWDMIVEHDAQRGLMSAGTPCTSGSDDTTNDLGLVNCHAYPVLGWHILERNQQKLVKMRNPWSVELYYGPYSDNASGADALTQDDRDELDHQDANDGVFFMRYEDYYAFTDYTSVNYDVENGDWSHDYQLTIEDDFSGSTTGSWSWCGSPCSRYTGTITNLSGVTNTIHAGLHTWRNRSYGKSAECDQNDYSTDSRRHGIFQSGDQYVYTSRKGSRYPPPKVFAPGETVTYTLELDLQQRMGMTKDWTFDAWGENGAIQVQINGKGASDVWPLVTRDDSLLPADERELEQTNPMDAFWNSKASTAEGYNDDADALQLICHQTMADMRADGTSIGNQKILAVSLEGNAADAESQASGAYTAAQSESDLANLQAYLSQAEELETEAGIASASAADAHSAANSLEDNDLASKISLHETTTASIAAVLNDAQAICDEFAAATLDSADQLAAQVIAHDALAAIQVIHGVATGDSTEISSISSQAALDVQDALASAISAASLKIQTETFAPLIQQLIYQNHASTTFWNGRAQEAENIQTEATAHQLITNQAMTDIRDNGSAIGVQAGNAISDEGEAADAEFNASGAYTATQGESDPDIQQAYLEQAEWFATDAGIACASATGAHSTANSLEDNDLASEISLHETTTALITAGMHIVQAIVDEFAAATLIGDQTTAQQRAIDALTAIQVINGVATGDNTEISTISSQTALDVQDALASANSACIHKTQTEAYVPLIQALIDYNPTFWNGRAQEAEDIQAEASALQVTSNQAMTDMRADGTAIGVQAGNASSREGEAADAESNASGTYTAALLESDLSILQDYLVQAEGFATSAGIACASAAGAHAAADSLEDNDLASEISLHQTTTVSIITAMNDVQAIVDEFAAVTLIGEQLTAQQKAIDALTAIQVIHGVAIGDSTEISSISSQATLDVQDALASATSASSLKTQTETYAPLIQALIDSNIASTAFWNGRAQEAENIQTEASAHQLITNQAMTDIRDNGTAIGVQAGNAISDEGEAADAESNASSTYTDAQSEDDLSILQVYLVQAEGFATSAGIACASAAGAHAAADSLEDNDLASEISLHQTTTVSITTAMNAVQAIVEEFATATLIGDQSTAQQKAIDALTAIQVIHGVAISDSTEISSISSQATLDVQDALASATSAASLKTQTETYAPLIQALIDSNIASTAFWNGRAQSAEDIEAETAALQVTANQAMADMRDDGTAIGVQTGNASSREGEAADAESNASSTYTDAQGEYDLATLQGYFVQAEGFATSAGIASASAAGAHAAADSLEDNDLASEISLHQTTTVSITTAMNEVQAIVEEFAAATLIGDQSTAQQRAIDALTAIQVIHGVATGDSTEVSSISNQAALDVQDALASANSAASFKTQTETYAPLIQALIDSNTASTAFWNGRAQEAEDIQAEADALQVTVNQAMADMRDDGTAIGVQAGNASTNEGFAADAESNASGAFTAAQGEDELDTLQDILYQAQEFENNAGIASGLAAEAHAAANSLKDNDFESGINLHSTTRTSIGTVMNDAQAIVAEFAAATLFGEQLTAYQRAIDALAAITAINDAANIDITEINTLSIQAAADVSAAMTSVDASLMHLTQTENYVDDIQAIIDAIVPAEFTLVGWENSFDLTSLTPCGSGEYVAQTELIDDITRIFIGHNCPNQSLRFTINVPYTNYIANFWKSGGTYYTPVGSTDDARNLLRKCRQNSSKRLWECMFVLTASDPKLVISTGIQNWTGYISNTYFS